MNKWLTVINRFTLIENSPRDFGSGERLYPSEIHTIEAIGLNQGTKVTQLAETMGVTKAAISQIVRKLEKKKYIQKYKGQENQKEVLLRLLKKGHVVYRGHKRYHAIMDSGIIERINRMTRGNTNLLEWSFPSLRAISNGSSMSEDDESVIVQIVKYINDKYCTPLRGCAVCLETGLLRMF